MASCWPKTSCRPSDKRSVSASNLTLESRSSDEGADCVIRVRGSSSTKRIVRLFRTIRRIFSFFNRKGNHRIHSNSSTDESGDDDSSSRCVGSTGTDDIQYEDLLQKCQLLRKSTAKPETIHCRNESTGISHDSKGESLLSDDDDVLDALVELRQQSGSYRLEGKETSNTCSNITNPAAETDPETGHNDSETRETRNKREDLSEQSLARRTILATSKPIVHMASTGIFGTMNSSSNDLSSAVEPRDGSFQIFTSADMIESVPDSWKSNRFSLIIDSILEHPDKLKCKKSRRCRLFRFRNPDDHSSCTDSISMGTDLSMAFNYECDDDDDCSSVGSWRSIPEHHRAIVLSMCTTNHPDQSNALLSTRILL